MNDTLDDLADDPAERLIARIVDRDARPADYDAFGQLAHGAPGRWNELLAALRDDDALHLGLEASLATAERVELPALPRGPAVLRVVAPRPLVAWSGWLAAAALALVWLTGVEFGAPAAPGARPPQLASTPPRGVPDGARPDRAPADGPQPAFYAGDAVVGELPARLVGSQRTPDGSGIELLYVQPVVRRTRVDHVFGMGQDEAGRPAPVPVDPAVLVHHENL